MSYHWSPDHGYPGATDSGNHASPGPSRGDYGAPPPIPPRPAGFGHQPLPAENRASGVQPHHEQPHSSSNPAGGPETAPSDYISPHLQSPTPTEATGSGSSDPLPLPNDHTASSRPLDSMDMINEMLDGISVSDNSHSTSYRREPRPYTYTAAAVEHNDEEQATDQSHITSYGREPRPYTYAASNAKEDDDEQAEYQSQSAAFSRESRPYTYTAPESQETSEDQEASQATSTLYTRESRPYAYATPVAEEDHKGQATHQSAPPPFDYRSQFVYDDIPETRVEEASRPRSPSLSVEPPPVLPPRQKAPVDANGNAVSALRLRPVTECIGLPVGFGTTWYTHPAAPKYYICSYCYEENIRHTMFANDFRGAYIDDGIIKICLFSRVRMKDRLFKEAIAKRSLTNVSKFMALRSTLPPCAGSDGIKGPNPRGHWYRVKNNEVPPMVVCKACYEDYILAQPFAVKFEPAFEQGADVWSCDMSVACISDEYKRCSAINNWARFVSSANTRLSVPKCPGTQDIYPEGGGKQWFEPVNGPRGFLICSACYCDTIYQTSEQTKWRNAGENTARVYGVSVRCCFGGLNMSLAAGRTLRETYDYNLFWKVVQTLTTEPMCDPKGTTNATWYTLKTDPAHYAICRACYVAIAETYGIGSFFMPKPSIPKSAKLICCLSRGIPRFPYYIARLMELVLTHDPAPLTELSNEYGAMPLCKQDNDFKNGAWYGWPACTICPECHHFFIRGTALAPSMPLQGQRLDNWRMCEMYSPRMRKMYLEACAASPPDPTALLNFSLQRRNIYANTMPKVRQMVSAQTIKFLQQQQVAGQSMFYSNLGRTYADTVGYTHTYGQAGVGYGFRNEWELDGARLGQQASAMADEVRNTNWTLPAGELERRWREVE